jgi:hypothetical protein
MESLPTYSQEQLNTLRLLAKHGEALSEAWMNYKKAVDNVILLHDEYAKAPNTKSIRLAYQAALINLESAKSSIHEFKDMTYENRLNEWLP